MMVVLSFLVNANSNYFQEANCDNNLPGGSGFTGYSSNYVNQLASQNYTTCSLSEGLKGSLIFDVNGDNFQEIVVMDDTNVKVYTTDCAFVFETEIGSTNIVKGCAMNFNGNNLQELVLSNTSDILVYEFDDTINSFQLLKNINYDALTGSDSVNIYCDRSTTDIVIGTALGSGNVMIFNLSSGTGSSKPAEFTYNPFPYELNQGGSATRKTADSLDYHNLVCNVRNGNYFGCAMLDSEGNEENVIGTLGSASFTVDDIFRYSAFVGRMGSTERVFVDLVYEKSSVMQHNSYVFDNSFSTEYFNQGITTSTNETSNWILADYDKDGNKDACHLLNNSASGNIEMRCYDSSFTSVKILQNFGAILNLTTIAIADFYPNNDFLTIATVEGLFIYNSTLGTPQQKFSTGVLSNYKTDNTGSIVSLPFSRVPVYVYTDNNRGFVISDVSVSESCGNGICEDFESEFSCPVDCVNITDTGLCTTDADCPSTYPICHITACVRIVSPVNYTCLVASDCPLTDSICFENLCVNSYSENTNTSLYNIDDQQTNIDNEVSNALQNGVDVMTGGSALVKFLVAMVIIILFSVGVMIIISINGGGNTGVVAGLLTALIMSILTTGLKMTSIVVPIIFFMLIAIGGVLVINSK